MADNCPISDSEPYAELWMGTHVSGPSRMKEGGQLLKEFLDDKPLLVGSVPPSYPGNDLPFLFKVLSVRTALSIQAHPDKEFARDLNLKFPNIYKGKHDLQHAHVLTCARLHPH